MCIQHVVATLSKLSKLLMIPRVVHCLAYICCLVSGERDTHGKPEYIGATLDYQGDIERWAHSQHDASTTPHSHSPVEEQQRQQQARQFHLTLQRSTHLSLCRRHTHHLLDLLLQGGIFVVVIVAWVLRRHTAHGWRNLEGRTAEGIGWTARGALQLEGEEGTGKELPGLDPARP